MTGMANLIMVTWINIKGLNNVVKALTEIKEM